MRTPAPAIFAGGILLAALPAATAPAAPWRLETVHIRLPKAIAQICAPAQQQLGVGSNLAYKRLHAFFYTRTPSQCKSDLAWVTRGEWRKDQNRREVLTLTDATLARARELRRSDPDNEPPRRLDRDKRLHFAGLLARAARSPAALAELRNSDPMLARQLEDPLVNAVLQGLPTLSPYQALLMTGRGLMLPSRAIDPKFRQSILGIVRGGQPAASDLKGIQLAARPGADFVLVVDVAESGGGNALEGRTARASTATRAQAPAGDSPAGSGGDLPETPRVRPAEFLVRDNHGTLPYRYEESIERLAKKYSLNLVSEIRFKPPSGPVQLTAARAFRTLLRQDVPIGECLHALATIFGLRYEYRSGVHFIRNPRWYWEEKYAHSDEDYERLKAMTRERRGELSTCASLLKLTRAQAEGLTVPFPELEALARYRPEVELYASLSPDQKSALRQASVPVVLFSPLQQRLFWRMLDIPSDWVPTGEARTFALQVLRTTRGERLEYAVQ